MFSRVRRLSAHRPWWSSVVVVCLCAVGVRSGAQTVTLDEVIARHVQARGTVDPHWSLERVGSLSFPDSNFTLAVHEWKGQGRYRSEVSMQGLTQIQSTDGHTGFKVDPFEGRKDAEALSDDDLKGLQSDADLEWPFVHAAAKGHRLEWVGAEEIDGGSAYGIRVVLNNGNEDTYWLDADTYMVIRVIDKQRIRGVDHVQELDYTDYERVDGVYVPMTEAQGEKGAKASQKSTTHYTSAQWRSDIDVTLYRRTVGVTP